MQKTCFLSHFWDNVLVPSKQSIAVIRIYSWLCALHKNYIHTMLGLAIKLRCFKKCFTMYVIIRKRMMPVRCGADLLVESCNVGIPHKWLGSFVQLVNPVAFSNHNLKGKIFFRYSTQHSFQNVLRCCRIKQHYISFRHIKPCNKIVTFELSCRKSNSIPGWSNREVMKDVTDRKDRITEWCKVTHKQTYKMSMACLSLRQFEYDVNVSKGSVIWSGLPRQM